VVYVGGERRDVSNLTPGPKKIAAQRKFTFLSKLSELFVHIFIL